MKKTNFQEAVLMAQFKHPNIISLYGVVNIGESVRDIAINYKALNKFRIQCGLQYV